MAMYLRHIRNIIVWTIILCISLAVISLIFGGSDFMGTFRASLFYFGIFILFAGALVGAGFSEMMYYGSKLYHVSSTYMRTIHRERMGRREGEFVFMVYSIVIGILMIFLANVL